MDWVQMWETLGSKISLRKEITERIVKNVTCSDNVFPAFSAIACDYRNKIPDCKNVLSFRKRSYLSNRSKLSGCFSIALFNHFIFFSNHPNFETGHVKISRMFSFYFCFWQHVESSLECWTSQKTNLKDEKGRLMKISPKLL